MGDFNWSTMGFLVVGAGVLIAGLGILSNWFKLRNPANIYEGIVFGSRHADNRDSKGRLIQDYYELSIRYKKGNKIIPAEIKSPVQYDKDEPLRIVEQNGTPTLFPHSDTGLVNGLLFSAAGTLLLATPFVNTRLGTNAASLLLALVLICIGGAILHIYISSRVYTANVIEGEITDVLLFQTGRENMKFVGGTKNFYPIITYEKDGKTRRFVSKYSSNMESTFKVGKKVPLYWSEKEHCLVEKKPGKELVLISVVMILFGLYGFIATLIK